MSAEEDAKPSVDDDVTETDERPVRILFAMSHPEVSMVSVSPLSPMTRLPVVVKVPLMLFEPMVPPETVRASTMYPSPIVVEAATEPFEFVVRTPAPPTPVRPRVEEVALIKEAFAEEIPVDDAYEDDAFVARRRVAKRFVVVAFVPVALVKLMSEIVDDARIRIPFVDDGVSASAAVLRTKCDPPLADAERTPFVTERLVPVISVMISEPILNEVAARFEVVAFVKMLFVLKRFVEDAAVVVPAVAVKVLRYAFA